MSSHAVVSDRREPWRYVVRTLVSVAALVAIGYWASFSLAVAALSGTDAEHWWWTGQFVSAVAGCALGVAALALGFSTTHRIAYRALLVVSLSIAMTWVIWGFGFGGF